MFFRRRAPGSLGIRLAAIVASFMLAGFHGTCFDRGDGDGETTRVNVGDIGLAFAPETLTALVRINTASGTVVEDALVTGRWSGDVVAGTQTARTGVTGHARFTRDATGDRNRPRSATLCVEDVSGENLVYDPGANRETCETLAF